MYSRRWWILCGLRGNRSLLVQGWIVLKALDHGLCDLCNESRIKCVCGLRLIEGLVDGISDRLRLVDDWPSWSRP